MMHSSISLYVQYGNFLKRPRLLLHSLHVSRAATDTLLPGNAGAATDGFHWWSRTRAWTHMRRRSCNISSRRRLRRRAQVYLFFIYSICAQYLGRKCSVTLNVVGGLGSVLLLLLTLASAMATATAAVVVRLAWALISLYMALLFPSLLRLEVC